jgi:asparagine synthase (glutamine-hydrolysing)
VNRPIAGIFDPTGSEGREAARTRVTAALAPHGEVATFQEGPLTLGWIAPEVGQPTRHAGLLCVMDGQLYNAHELLPDRPSANGPGPVAATATADQNERAAAFAFRRDGEQALPSLRGDFALVLYDPETHEGILVCDQMGNRMLVFHAVGERILFALEARDLMRMLPRRPDPDVASLAHWIGISGPPGDRTMFAGIRRVRPGHFLRFGKGRLEQQCYWRPTYRETVRISREEASYQIREGLARAIDRRAPADVTSGFMLSGGLDSSSICAMTKRCIPPERQPIAAYSAVFPHHSSVDETELIEELTAEVGVPSVRIAVEDGSVLAGALRYIETWQLPPTSPNLFFWNPLLQRASQDGVQVLLDGDGGDELFAYCGHLLADRLSRGRLLSMLSLATNMPSGSRWVSPSQLRYRLEGYALRPLIPEFARRLRRRHRPRTWDNPAWFAPAVSQAYVDTDEQWAFRETPGPRWAAWLANTLTWTAGPVAGYDHIRRRAAMNGLEARHPLNDVDLIEMMLSFPPEYAYDYRHDRPLFRRAMKGILPESIRLRPVKSFFDEVFQGSIRSHDLEPIRRLLAPPAAELGAYLDLELMGRELLAGPPPTAKVPTRDWCVQVWRLVTAECWLRTLADPSFPAETLSSGVLRRPSYELLAPF